MRQLQIYINENVFKGSNLSSSNALQATKQRQGSRSSRSNALSRRYRPLAGNAGLIGGSPMRSFRARNASPSSTSPCSPMRKPLNNNR